MRGSDSTGSTAPEGEARPGKARRENPDPNKWPAIGLGLLILTTVPSIFATAFFIQPRPTEHPWAERAEAIGVEPHEIVLGEMVYRSSCASCHGPNGDGVPRLGKPLRISAYVREHSDGEIFRLIADGRLPNDPENTTGSLMPARGARGLDDRAIGQVVAYLRAIQEPGAPAVAVDRWELKTVAVASNASGGGSAEPMGGSAREPVAPTIGRDAFVAPCSSCHGPGGEGVEGLGKALADSAFVKAKSDKELITFIKMGRPIWDAENTTGLDMPPKGGNPALTDEQIADIVTYIRSLNE